jgi:hypothetical protein
MFFGRAAGHPVMKVMNTARNALPGATNDYPTTTTLRVERGA